MLAPHYFQILHLHVGCVILSGTLFFTRGVLRLSGQAVANHWALRLLSVVIDTTLLTAAILLTLIIRQYPLQQAWLTVKVALLLVYIVLGSLALKRARTRRGRGAAFAGALATFAYLVGVAVTRNPWGLLSRL